MSHYSPVVCFNLNCYTTRLWMSETPGRMQVATDCCCASWVESDTGSSADRHLICCASCRPVPARESLAHAVGTHSKTPSTNQTHHQWALLPCMQGGAIMFKICDRCLDRFEQLSWPSSFMIRQASFMSSQSSCMSRQSAFVSKLNCS